MPRPSRLAALRDRLAGALFPVSRDRLLADSTADLIIRLGADGRHDHVSAASLALLGFTPRELLGLRPRDLAHPMDGPALSAHLTVEAAFGHAAPIAYRVRHKDGGFIWIEVTSRMLADGGRVIVMRDITRRKAAEQALQAENAALQRDVLLDGLTGIANRRCFDLMLDREVRRAARNEVPLSLLMFDVDHFKAFNDAHGHPAGDACLQAVAGVAEAVARRAGDLVARYGGEEFALLLPDTDEHGAASLAERLRVAAATLGGIAAPITVSLGAATVHPRGTDATGERLVALADAGLYQAKRGGRNRVGVRAARLLSAE